MKRLGKIKTLAVASLAAIALAAPIALAQTTGQDNQPQAKGEGHHRGGGKGRGHRGGHRGGGHGGFMFRGLNLTEDQQARVKQIHESFAERTKGLHEQMRAKHQELRQLEEGGTFNEALATQKLTEIAGLQAKLMGERFRTHQEMLSVLTAEQKAQMEQQRAERKQRREQRKGRRGARPGQMME